MAEGWETVEARLAVLAQQLVSLTDGQAELRRIIEGPPREESVRGRLHTLEAENAAAKVAAQALAQATARERRARERETWSRRRERTRAVRVAAWGIGVLLAAYPYVAHFSGWGG